MAPRLLPPSRVVARGPSLFVGDDKLVVRAVTYGTFAPGPDGSRFPPRWLVRRDFAGIAALGANAIRTYTPPPDWLLHEARAAGLRVLIGIWWEGRDCSFDEPGTRRAAEAAVRDAVGRGRHFADVVLGYLLANEVPPLTVRFHGRRPIERFLRRLYDVAKAVDPDALVSYANYPTTEYLQLEFLDFHTWNVYLRDRDRLAAYVDRLANLAHGKPVLLGEIGDDSLRLGERWQAELLDWTLPLLLDRGVAGVCVFAWTDDWVVGAHRVDDWAFGLVDRFRRPKAAFDVVARRLQEPPLARRGAHWPRVSVVVCNYNGGRTLDETLRSLRCLDYPDYEVVYVDDGSTDDSLAIARRHADRVRIVAQANAGLSAARNVGAAAATGEIVAYIDSDAFADRDWLRHLVAVMREGGYAAVGGPNLTPASDGYMAQLVAVCPGNPTHVLIDDRRADHIAGVNMAFRRDVLISIGGFDPVHRRAGDDVDVCWRLQDAGHALGFSPVAIVWHHRRPSLRRYLRQQLGYGEAEHQLAKKHRERFNGGGCIRWHGRVYLAPCRPLGWWRPVVYHGRLGEALFQQGGGADAHWLLHVPTWPQWYLLACGLLLLGVAATPAAVAGAAMLAASFAAALVQGLTTQVPLANRGRRRDRLQKVAVVTAMHFVHPLVRWYGRAAAAARELRLPRWPGAASVLRELCRLGRGPKERRSFWGAVGAEREAVLREIRDDLKQRGAGAAFGADRDNHDLVVLRAFATARVYTAPEHWQQALCVGLRLRGGRTLLLAAGVLPALTAAVLGVPAAAAFAVGAAASAAAGLLTLAARARLRQEVWAVVALVMQRRAAVAMAAPPPSPLARGAN